MDWLLQNGKYVIACPAWELNAAASTPSVLQALEENRMLILEMRNLEGNLAAAEARNRFVLEHAEQLWLPHVAKGGMIDRLIREMDVREKMIIDNSNQGNTPWAVRASSNACEANLG